MSADIEELRKGSRLIRSLITRELTTEGDGMLAAGFMFPVLPLDQALGAVGDLMAMFVSALEGWAEDLGKPPLALWQSLVVNVGEFGEGL